MGNKIICNKCGKILPTERVIINADFIEINKKLVYFSSNDVKTMKCIICEECSDKLLESFVVPAVLEETTELL